MIAFSPIWAVVLRHVHLYRHDINLLLMLLYWPILDILTWGFLGSWIQHASGEPEFQNYEAIALLGILLWQVVGRGGNIIAITFAEELWQNNMVNLFSLPLRIAEWICGIILLYAITIGITIGCCMLLIYSLYDVSMWYMVSSFMIFLPPLFICGIWLGFTCLHIMVLRGKRGTELGFVAIWFMLPFSGAYYPIEVLPAWGQMLSAALPMSYVFQGMRAYLMHQQDPTSYLIKGYLLSIIYAAIAIILFAYLFNRSKVKGLARLSD
jgi:ABC-2 type transport system permease protein